ncbi:hypothetical protein BGW36DRAFT_152598 [Talaromyces proteolyticus]|uniref:FAD-binding domain-containing protein n=1 Tax=Talaromyces proteolyticus TaxID=1131652 RepID=A0AAD4KX93_9EURO|nr:uncharacterized protein BGW36DRAFT_152598 [Talaromyces proteolyticus]KAH8698913.1 hypothetical protein BGW36DRAFT_152598 [Talaromyces proteolyticus]
MANTDNHVIIVGAGATGLLIAQGLKKAGIRATVYERYTREEYEERSGDWTVALHWSIPYIEACLPPELFAKLKSAETNRWEEHDPHVANNIPLVNGRTGEIMAKMPMPSARRVVRGKLRDLLKTEIDIQYGSTLTDIQIDHPETKNSVTALFNGGDVVAKGNMLIGADGARSPTRSFLVDQDTGKLDTAKVMILNAFPKFTREQALFIRQKSHPIALLSPHPYQKTLLFATMVDVVDPEKPETWVFQFSLSIYTDEVPPTDEKERRHLFKAYLSTYCEPYRSVSQWLVDDIKVSGDKFHYWGNITPWNNHGGKISIAGDAAHPMLPFRAQGLNNAMEDAKLYVDAIKTFVYDGKDLKSCIDDYDKSSYSRGKLDINLSVDQMHAYGDWDAVMNGPLLRGGGYGKSH